MKHRLAPYVESTYEAGMACMLTMVQGNGLALTATHWLTASQTGLLAGAVASTGVIVTRLRKPWLLSLTLGLVTIPIDALVHPGQFDLAEAVITGVGAFVLSLATSTMVHRFARGRAGPPPAM